MYNYCNNLICPFKYAKTIRQNNVFLFGCAEQYLDYRLPTWSYQDKNR